MSSVAAAVVQGRPGGRARSEARPAPVRAWLWTLVVLVVVMVAIGGATRLTGSGLSITEWKPVTGAVPPLTETAWAAEFEKYRNSSQYRNLNRGMGLGEFKTIYWWEWSHRQLGRLLGLMFFGPLVWFWARGSLSGRTAVKLLAIGALGGLQATVGWIMVASGLEPGMVAVAPLKLTIHLLLASLILLLLVWEATAGPRDRASGAPATMEARAALGWGRAVAGAFLALVIVQIGLGGLVAGSRAGLTYNTWPLMDGRFVPPAEALFVVRPWIENFVDNPALVQLNHRLVAYLVVAFAAAQVLGWFRADPGSPGAVRSGILAGLALAQMALGIVTLLLSVPLWAGLAHQLLAMALLVAATIHVRRSGQEAALMRAGAARR